MIKKDELKGRTHMTSAEQGWNEVERWILEQRDYGQKGSEIDPDLDLFEADIISSLQVVELVAVIERLGGVKVDRLAIKPEDFRTLRAIQRSFFPSVVPDESRAD
jgi:acyl carrier protein